MRPPMKKRWNFKRICVFCGSKPGSKSIFSDATVELGKQLVINEQKPTIKIVAFSICYRYYIYILCDFIRLKETLIWFMVEEVKV